MGNRARVGIVVLLMGGALVSAPAALAAPCSVPSMTYPTIQAALNDASCDPITVAPGTFAEELVISRSLTLNGAGVGQTIVDPASGRPVTISAGTVTITGITLRGGNVVAGHGGGISLNGTLTLDGVEVRDNVAGFSAGGIIPNSNSTLTVRNSTISGNTALDGSGGALNIQFDTTVRIEGSTISGNSASVDGGGVYGGTGGTIAIVNSTISGNMADDDGGGIRTFATTNVRNTTVTLNRADHDADGSGDGGGAVDTSFSTLTLANTIVAGNVDETPAGSVVNDCQGDVDSQGYNLVGDVAGCTFTPATGDLTNTAPGLGPLAASGGPTLTHPLQAGSPAVDAGNPTGCTDGSVALTTDQRGLPRTVDGDQDGSPRCDIGAYEHQVASKQVASKQVALKAKPKRVEPGEKTRLRATITPCGPETRNDEVQFRKGSKVLAEKTVNDACVAQKRVKVKRRTKFGAFSPADFDSVADAAKKIVVKVAD